MSLEREIRLSINQRRVYAGDWKRPKLSGLKLVSQKKTVLNYQPCAHFPNGFWRKPLEIPTKFVEAPRASTILSLPQSIASCVCVTSYGWQSTKLFGRISYRTESMCSFFGWFSFILYQLRCSRFLMLDFHLFHFLCSFSHSYSHFFLSNQVCLCFYHTWQNISTYVVTTFNCNFWCVYVCVVSRFSFAAFHSFIRPFILHLLPSLLFPFHSLFSLSLFYHHLDGFFRVVFLGRRVHRTNMHSSMGARIFYYVFVVCKHRCVYSNKLKVQPLSTPFIFFIVHTHTRQHDSILIRLTEQSASEQAEIFAARCIRSFHKRFCTFIWFGFEFSFCIQIGIE